MVNLIITRFIKKKYEPFKKKKKKKGKKLSEKQSNGCPRSLIPNFQTETLDWWKC